MSFREAIEDRIGPIPNYIDATETLLDYYGPDSLACHGLRRLDDTHIEAFFIVPENICGPQTKPPMFNQLRYADGTFATRTGDEDANQHFIDTVVIKGIPIKLVAGHNIAGLNVEAAQLVFNQDREEPEDLMLTEIDFIRYKGFVLPQQDLLLSGPLEKNKQGVVLSPKTYANNLVRAEANKFRCESVGRIEQEIKKIMLWQHWLFETTAQGIGSAVAQSRGISIKDMVPALMQSERSRFGKIPIKAGDLISTIFELLRSPVEQGFGNTEISVNQEPYGSQRRFMVRFYPINQIAEGIQAARQQSA